MKDKIKNAAGWLLSILGWVVLLMSWISALYITFVLLFTGGLVEAAQGIMDLDLVPIVKGLCKFVLCGIPGGLVAIVGSLFGCILLVKGDDLR